MTDPARRRRVEEVCDAALDRLAGERAAFMAAACGDDHALRQEVEALLAHARTAEGFLAAPMGAVAAHVLGEATGAFVGQQISSYRILAQLGAGGMGEVYRARDTKLGRDVAIKILPKVFVSDPDRLARFKREARVLASLSHPHIGAIYGLEDADGVTALVMELVEGDDISQRIARGAIPIKDALSIARQIAEALEAAHEQGIIHRDLKPANIKVRPDGTVKVLDFGLAKAMEPGGVLRSVSQAATITSPAMMTGVGAVLGTAAYMSPEQARGKPVDNRTDIWAFGCVLFEMLTGRRAFGGETTQDTLAAVVAGEPAMNAVPAGVRPLVEKCLRKDPRSRWQSIGDVRLAIEEGPVIAVAAPTHLPWAIAAVLALALAATGISSFVRPPQDAQTVRFGVPIPGGSARDVDFALSPDGRSLAITTVDGGRRYLWVRSIDMLDARLIADTEGAGHPFWSPDGTKIGFVAESRLRTVSSAGGPAVTLVEDVGQQGFQGGSWNRDGTIIFTAGGLRRVDEAGGAVTLVRAEESARFSSPAFLPGGRTFLYTQEGRVLSGEDSGVFIGSLDGATTVRVVPDQSKALYASGFLVFRREGRLVAQRFDADTLALNGAAIPITSEEVTGRLGYAPNVLFSASDSGTLAYQARALQQLAWVNRAGNRLELVGPPEQYDHFRLSPDGERVAMSDNRLGAGNLSSEIATVDLGRGVLEVLTVDPQPDLAPLWSPDGNQIVFASRRSGEFNPYVTDGPNRERLLANVSGGGWPLDWSPDGRLVLWETDGDMWLVPLTGEREPYSYLSSAFTERGGQFSPDGDWVAYSSNESGRDEVYVRALGRDQRFVVSGRGGKEPAWRRDGRELFYVAGDGMLTSVSVMLGEASVAFGRPQSLFPAPLGSFRRNYEVSVDGQRFLVAGPATSGGAAITVVLNWQAGLER